VQQLTRSTSEKELCDATDVGGVPARELLLLLQLLPDVVLTRLGLVFPKINDPVKARETLLPETTSLRPSANLTFDSAIALNVY
jgi:hypothetical protein